MTALLNACAFIPSAGSTTDWTYSAAVSGYNSPSQAGVVNGATYCYRAESSDLTQWEIGTGTYNTSTGVLTRSTVLYNSSGTGTATGQSGAGTKISFSAAPRVAITATATEVRGDGVRNIVDFGADMTGTVDSTAALTDAWAALVADGGGTLIIPPGTVKLDTTSLIDLAGTGVSGISIVGHGRGVSFFHLNNASSSGIRIKDNPYGVLRDFGIYASGEQTTGALLTLGATGGSTIFGMNVERLYLGDGFRGLWIRAATNVKCSDIQITTGGYFSGTFKASSCFVEVDSTLGPVTLVGIDGTTLNTKVQHGIKVVSCDILDILQCHLSNCYSDMVHVEPSSAAIAHMAISNCDFDNDNNSIVNGIVAFVASGSNAITNVRITDNMFRSNAGAPNISLNASLLTNYLESGNQYTGTAPFRSITASGGTLKLQTDINTATQLIETKSLSGTSVTFLNIPVNAKYLRFGGGGISSDTASREMWLQVTTDGGSTWQTTAGYYAGYHVTSAGTIAVLSSSQSLIKTDATNTAAQSITIDLWIEYGTGIQPKLTGIAETTSGGRYYQNTFFVGNSSVVNGFRFVWSGSGNFDAGSVSFYAIC